MKDFGSTEILSSHWTRVQLAKLAILAVAVVVGPAATAWGQATILTNPFRSHDVQVNVDSGKFYLDGNKAKVVWSEDVVIADAKWIRLKFSHLVLGGSPLGGPSSTLRITSLADGATQHLNTKTAAEWRNTSAFFNGNGVRLELMAIPNGRMNMVVVDVAVAGEADELGIASTICDSVDDRELSDDPRAGRTAPGGCTGWLFNDRNNCMLTAGHCAPSTEVMLFNVPLSDAAGNRQFPGPEDQYAVDFTSFQAASAGIGNDWCYFGCFANTETGLTAFEAQGDSYQLADPADVQADDVIRITGYGSTSFPVDPMWNGAQKTHTGPYALFTNEELGYRTDTTGGNSGSPVILENTGFAIGIHTHGGCGASGQGTNFGTGFLNSSLANALANPQGICINTVDFDFLTPLPESINPAGGDTVDFVIGESDFTTIDKTALLNIDSGNGFEQIPVQVLGDSTFRAEFPATSCGSVVSYFFSIESDMGEVFTAPINAPSVTFVTISADQLTTSFEDDFETDMNWTISGNAEDGQWERGVPAGGGDRNDPPIDADGSGSCFVTDNADGNSDVDGGSTVLTSPIMDATTTVSEEAMLTYFRWFNTTGGNDDTLLVEISNDAGVNWTTIESVVSDGGNSQWVLQTVRIRDFVEPNAQLRVRFTASDVAAGSVVEAGIDGVSVQLIDCFTPPILGDVNQDGEVNLLDVQPFIDLLTSNQFQLEADINQDGVVDLLDVSDFVDLL